jgi:hypothetical protein
MREQIAQIKPTEKDQSQSHQTVFEFTPHKQIKAKVKQQKQAQPDVSLERINLQYAQAHADPENDPQDLLARPSRKSHGKKFMQRGEIEKQEKTREEQRITPPNNENQ